MAVDGATENEPSHDTVARTELEKVKAELDEANKLIVDLQHQILTLRDHAIGAEAAVGVARVDRARARARASRLSKELKEIRASASWRVGSSLVRPFRPLGKRRRNKASQKQAIAKSSSTRS